MSHLPQYLTIIGLLLDIIGVIIVFCHAIPPESKEAYVEAMPKHLEKYHRRWANWGIGLIIFGFVLQLVSAIVTISINP